MGLGGTSRRLYSPVYSIFHYFLTSLLFHISDLVRLAIQWTLSRHLQNSKFACDFSRHLYRHLSKPEKFSEFMP